MNASVELRRILDRVGQRFRRVRLWGGLAVCWAALAVIGFALYPLLPPRLLPSSYGSVDTLDKIGGLWSFDSGAMAKVSNQYAAMPSLHCGWALWVTFVLWPAARKPWARLLVVLYPLITVFCIVVTANHYFLDAVGGAVVFCAGYGMAVLTVRHLSPILTRLGSGRPSSA